MGFKFFAGVVVGDDGGFVEGGGMAVWLAVRSASLVSGMLCELGCGPRA